MKIAILNVKFSPNLGDAIIADCIEQQLRSRIPNLDIFSLDFGGREDYQMGGSLIGKKHGLMDTLNRMPKVVQKTVRTCVVPPLTKYRYSQVWKEKLSGCDAIIIGGGHLIMDVDQYFPSRILLALQQCPKNIPVFIHSVGVSGHMTPKGLNLFKKIFNHGSLKAVSVRDERSQQNWIKHFTEPKPEINRDPGILTSLSYPKPKDESHKDNKRKTIAFGVASPASMVPHSDSKEGVICGDIDFYMNAFQELTKKYRIVVFTNGDDWDQMELVKAHTTKLPRAIQEYIQFAPRPIVPEELIHIIGNSDVLIAHRLHANIISYALNIPHIGLGWDSKLQSFFESTKRHDFIITSNMGAVEKISKLVDTSAKHGLDATTRKKVLAETGASFDKLAERLTALK